MEFFTKLLYNGTWCLHILIEYITAKNNILHVRLSTHLHVYSNVFGHLVDVTCCLEICLFSEKKTY